MTEAVLLAGGRVAARFKVQRHDFGRAMYVHLENDEDVAVHTVSEDFVFEGREVQVRPFAYRFPPGSADMDVRPLKRELWESIGDVWIVELPDERTLLVPA